MHEIEPVRFRPPRHWFHGSPLQLKFVREGSTVTPIVELAKVFSHKPSRVDVRIEEHNGDRRARITHTGAVNGYLYRVLVASPDADLRQHPTSVFGPGEEMLATRGLPLEFIRELPLSDEPEEYVVIEEA